MFTGRSTERKMKDKVLNVVTTEEVTEKVMMIIVERSILEEAAVFCSWK